MADLNMYLEQTKSLLQDCNLSNQVALFLQKELAVKAVEHQAALKEAEKRLAVQEANHQAALKEAEKQLAVQEAEHQAELKFAVKAAEHQAELKLAEKDKELAVKVAEHKAELKEAKKELVMAVKSAQNQAEKELFKKEQEMLQRIFQLKQKSEREIAVLRYRYALVSSRCWLERLFRDVCSFASEKTWPDAKSISGNGGPVSMSTVNKYLLTHPPQWTEFVKEKNLETVEPFPILPQGTLLYGALSFEVHNPPEMCVLHLDQGVTYQPYISLLRDIGEYYREKEHLAVSYLNLSEAIAGMIRDFEEVEIDQSDL